MSWLMTPPPMYRGIRARARISIRFSRGHRPTWHHPTATRCSSWGSSMDRSFKTLIGSIPTSVLSSVHPSSCDDRHLRADGNQRCPNKKKQRFKKKKRKKKKKLKKSKHENSPICHRVVGSLFQSCIPSFCSPGGIGTIPVLYLAFLALDLVLKWN